ncbi:eukaryotic translation initiation factor 3 subunit B-like [Diaphorina citri]|nr:eukaryotic translation initiation factor 3 subunit B-like [Diaphorina citri]
MNKASKELIEKRRKLFKQFEELREKLRETWEAEKEERKYLRNLVDTDELDSENVEEEVVEFVIKEEITICE